MRKRLLVDRDALAGAQADNDVILAHRILKAGFVTDVSPILAEARLRNGGAIDAGRRLSRIELSQDQSEGAPGGQGLVVGNRLRRSRRQAREGVSRKGLSRTLQQARVQANDKSVLRWPRHVRRRERITKSALPPARARGLKADERRLFRGRSRRKRVGGDRDRIRLPAEAPPGHADVAEQPHQGVRLVEVRRELPIYLQRLPIESASRS